MSHDEPSWLTPRLLVVAGSQHQPFADDVRELSQMISGLGPGRNPAA